MSRSFEVKPSDSIGNLKNQISDKLAATIIKAKLLDYQVKKNFTLTLMRKSCGLVPIFIINLDGNERYGKRRWPVNVKLSDTVSNLKARISYLTYPHDPKELVIVFNNIVLQDHCILADFHIT
nr:hypothetical protein [Tanacetum cinerariifolium]